MMDFLSFKSFISTEILIIFYYLGAVFLPVFAWLLGKCLLRHDNVINKWVRLGKTLLWQQLTWQQRSQLLLFFLVFFMFLELFWRMLFEFIIAYLQIRDALVGT